MQQPTFSETQRSEVKLMYTEFRVFRGTVLATRTNVHKGIGELESLSIDPQIPQNLRAKILFYLAKAYQSTYMITLDIGFIRTKTQQKVAFAYFDEAMSRLEAALLAGFNNWKLIEKDYLNYALFIQNIILNYLSNMDEFHPGKNNFGKSMVCWIASCKNTGITERV